MIKKLPVLFFLLLLQLGAFAQEQLIKGRVTDQEGAPLPGTTIMLKDGSNATVSDINGDYRLLVGEGRVLVFSFIGFATREIIIKPGMSRVDVSMQEDATQLSEVVVIGALGIKRSARELGTASEQISAEELNQAKVVNPILGLGSKVAGLRINMFDSKVDPDVQVNLRGIRSHTGSNEPLYVVDGVPVPNINRLNPNDIESINVLKGANAAALYGSEGVNGALMITTRKGKAGQQKITYSNTSMFEQIMRLPEQQNLYGQGMNGVYDPQQYQSWGPRFDGEVKPVGGVLPDGSQWELPYAAVEDGRKSFFNTGFSTQNDLAFSGGDERSTYYFSLQDVYRKGIVPEDVNRRTGARFNGSRSFGKLSTSYNVNYIFNHNNVTPSEPWANVYRMPANIPVTALSNWEQSPFANPDYYFSNSQPNPYFNIDNRRDITKEQTLSGNIELDYTFTDWFKAIYRMGLYNRNTDLRSTTGKFTYTTPGRRNIAGSISDEAETFRRLNSDLILQFNRDFGKFNTRLLIGQNIRSDEGKNIGISSSAMVVPGLYNQDNRTGELGGGAGISQYRQMATYGEFSAGYDNWLFLTFTGRQEAVSVLSEQNRSYFYPGISSSFVFSDAIAALQDSHLLSFGKAYVSYNKTGNVPLEPYQLQNVYTQGSGFPYGNLSGFQLGASDANPDLRPEFVTSFELGAQLSFFNNRLHFEGAYVNAETKDGIIQSDVSAATGFTAAWVNAFNVRNQIVELSLDGDIIRNGTLRWNLGGNFTYYNSRVQEIYGDIDRLFVFRQNYLLVGKPYNSYMFSDYERDPQGRIIVDPQTGNPVGVSELYYGGTGTPPYQIGMNTSVNYKGFQLAAQFDWRMGAVVYTEAAARMISDGTSPLTTAYGREPFVIPNSVVETAPGVYEENTSIETAGDAAYFQNYVAKVQSNYAVSADFFKLRELSLSYTVPAKLLAGQKLVKDVSLGLVGRNLFSIWAKDNIYNDPEFVYRGGSSEGYMSWRHLPPTRMYGFHVNVSF